LKLPLVNSKPVLHRPIESARLSRHNGVTSGLWVIFPRQSPGIMMLKPTARG
jgi:hypothetical protein